MATIERAVGGVSFALTDEQKELRALAREFASKEIRPKSADYDERSHHPDDLIAKAHSVGLMNLHVPEELGGPGAFVVRRHARRRGAELGLLGHRHLDRRERARLGPDHSRGLGGAEGDLAAAAPRIADPLLVRAIGAGRRVGCRAPADHRGSARRRVRPERLEDLHHERRPRRVDGRVRQDRPGEGPSRHVGVHRPDGHAGRHDRAAPREDGAALDRHVRLRAHRRRRARREPDRRGGRGLQDRDEDARLHPAREPRPEPSASRRPPTSTRSRTRRSASRSTCRSRCTRASTS